MQLAERTAMMELEVSSMNDATAVNNKDALNRNERKWGRQLMKAGWVAFPTTILEKQRALGLDALDINIILQIAKHWWETENPPFPSKGVAGVVKARNSVEDTWTWNLSTVEIPRLAPLRGPRARVGGPLRGACL